MKNLIHSYLFMLSIFLMANTKIFGQSYGQLNNNLEKLISDRKYDLAIPVALTVRDAALKEFGESSRNYLRSFVYLGFLYERVNNNIEAESFYKLALTNYKKALGEADPDYVFILTDLADLYYRTAKLQAAEPLYEQALTIREKFSADRGKDYTSNLNQLATVYLNLGKYKESESACQKNLANIKMVYGEQSQAYGDALNNIADFYNTIGNYTAAETSYEKSLYIFKNILGLENDAYATTETNLAGLYINMGNYAAADPLFRQALIIMSKISGTETYKYAIILNNFAKLYQLTQNLLAAETFFKQAISIFKKTVPEDNPAYASALCNLAVVYTQMRNFAAAEPLFKQSLLIRKKNFGEVNPIYASNLMYLATLYRIKGNYTEAEILFKQALDIDKRLLGKDDQDLEIAEQDLAILYKVSGDYVSAEKYALLSNSIIFKYLYKNFNFLSESEKIIWTEKQNSDFDFSVSLLFENPRLSATFLESMCNQQLQLKGMILNDSEKALDEARKNNNIEFQQLVDKWHQNKTLLLKQYGLPLERRIPLMDSLENITSDMEKLINLQSSGFRIDQQNLNVGFKQVNQKLNDREAAIEFIRFSYYHIEQTDSVFYAAFVILPNSDAPRFVPLCEEKELAKLLMAVNSSSDVFIKEFYGDTLGKRAAKSNSIYNLIWKPLLPYLQGIDKLTIAPAGLLNRIAFGALPFDNKSYLTDHYEIRQYASVREIAEQKTQPVQAYKTDAVLYGGIRFDLIVPVPPVNNAGIAANASIFPDAVKRGMSGYVWPPLPGTLDEVNRLNTLFKANAIATTVITGPAATEESLKQLSGHSPRILHIATHGFALPDVEHKKQEDFNKKNPFTLADNPMFRSGILMAGANRVWSGGSPVNDRDDGIVTAYEIADLDLSNTELVTLSACETALGDIKGTEGVFGLQRAFKLAGVQNMLLSLWKIPDAQTSELMNLFYTNTLKKGTTYYEALHNAQETMRKEKYAPYYWAGFVLIE